MFEFRTALKAKAKSLTLSLCSTKYVSTTCFGQVLQFFLLNKEWTLARKFKYVCTTFLKENHKVKLASTECVFLFKNCYKTIANLRKWVFWKISYRLAHFPKLWLQSPGTFGLQVETLFNDKLILNPPFHIHYTKRG